MLDNQSVSDGSAPCGPFTVLVQGSANMIARAPAPRLPLEIWYQVFDYLDLPCNEVKLGHWPGRVPECKFDAMDETMARTTRALTFEDNLFPGSAKVVWQWISSRVKWKIEDEVDSWMICRLESELGATVNHVSLSLDFSESPFGWWKTLQVMHSQFYRATGRVPKLLDDGFDAIYYVDRAKYFLDKHEDELPAYYGTVQTVAEDLAKLRGVDTLDIYIDLPYMIEQSSFHSVDLATETLLLLRVATEHRIELIRSGGACETRLRMRARYRKQRERPMGRHYGILTSKYIDVSEAWLQCMTDRRSLLHELSANLSFK